MVPNTKFYKFLNEDGRTPQQGYLWHLPGTGHGPQDTGAWLPTLWGKLEHCKRGYHVVTLDQAPQWLAPVMWEVDVWGEINRREDKCVVSNARLSRKIDLWNERTQRIFAADCAEHVLHYWTAKYPDDDRPAKAIQAARDYAEGRITKDAANAAANAAAYAAANAAAFAAANAANAAADAAADAANAERKWQVEHLREMLNLYDA